MEEEIVHCMYCSSEMDISTEEFEVLFKTDEKLHYYHPYCFYRMRQEEGTVGKDLWQ